MLKFTLNCDINIKKEKNYEFNGIRSKSFGNRPRRIRKENFLDLLNKEELKEFLGELGLNPNKWIRLRTSQVKFEISIEKLKFLSYEVKKLLSSDQKEKLKNIIGYENLADVLEKENFLDLLNKEELKEFLGELGLNPNKWIRLRTSFLQPLKEIEIEVSSMKEANEFMEAIGFAHKCYLEKRRTTYSLADHLIEVDTWPKIPTYFELEGKNEEDIENVLNLLGYSIKDKNVVSCIVDEIYEMYGFPKTSNFKELKF